MCAELTNFHAAVHAACCTDSNLMKCFKRIILIHIQIVTPDTLDPLQFTYRANRSTDAISTMIHTALTQLGNKYSYVRMLFINYSSAFNTVIPSMLANKLSTLVMLPTICNWVLDILTGRPQSVRMLAVLKAIYFLNLTGLRKSVT